MKNVSLPAFAIRFTPSLFMCVITLFFMLLFVRLGIWQLQRAAEKQEMLAKERLFSKQAPVLWKPRAALPSQYQRIRVTGRFLSQVVLLDNQHHRHEWGYHVLSALLLADGRVVMVDRGFIDGDVTRQTLPSIDNPRGIISLEGGVYYASKKQWLLGESVEKRQEDTIVIELFDTKALSQFLHKSVYPFMIRLGEQEASGYVRDWPVVAMSPERHYAYAVQWFAIAVVIFIIFVALNIKKRDENGLS